MPDIHIRRDHTLGLPQARRLAWQWAEQAADKFELACRTVAGERDDEPDGGGEHIEFSRPGVKGRLVVADDHFELTATLGFLLGAFRQKIEAEIERNFDAVLAAEALPPPASGAARDA